MIGFLLLSILIFAAPATAQDALRVDKLLNDSATSFRQDNYFQGVSQVTQACGMLRANPTVSPGNNYIDIAGNCLDAVNKSIRDCQTRGDIQNVTRRAYALQPLIQSLIEWDSNNPRWHYEKGMLFRTQSASMNDRFPPILQQAIGEFKKALSMPGASSYHEQAQNQIANCEQLIAKRNTEFSEYRKSHPEPRGNSQPNMRPYSAPIPQTTYCPKCGGTHAPGVCPYTHGG